MATAIGTALGNINQPEIRREWDAIFSQWRDYERDSKGLINLSTPNPKAAKEGIDPLYKKEFIPFRDNLESFIKKWPVMTDKAGRDTPRKQ